MSKRNEEIQRLAEDYWRKVEAGGIAYEYAPKTLVVASFHDGFKCALSAHKSEIRDIVKQHNAAMKEACNEIASLKIRLEIAARKEAQP